LAKIASFPVSSNISYSIILSFQSTVHNLAADETSLNNGRDTDTDKGVELRLAGCSPTPASGGRGSVKTKSKTLNVDCTAT
jgi:hypothetical protein